MGKRPVNVFEWVAELQHEPAHLGISGRGETFPILLKEQKLHEFEIQPFLNAEEMTKLVHFGVRTLEGRVIKMQGERLQSAIFLAKPPPKGVCPFGNQRSSATE